MKRFHVHIRVENLSQSIAFYERLFAAPPTRVEADYAKWMLEDPRVNFAISTRGGAAGLDHLGFQTDTSEELTQLKTQIQSADVALVDEGATSCVTPKVRSIGLPIHKALLGNIFIRWATFPYSMKPLPTPLKNNPVRAVCLLPLLLLLPKNLVANPF